MTIWQEITQLEGTTLKTLDRHNPFDIVKVGEQNVIVKPHARNIERSIQRKAIEDSFNELVTHGELTRSDIRNRYASFNPAYVAAILSSLTDVTFSVKPIRLYYKGR